VALSLLLPLNKVVARVGAPLPPGAGAPARRLHTLVKLRLAAEILSAYVRARRSLRRSGLAPTVAALRTQHADPPVSVEAQRRLALRLAHAVGRTLSPLPGDTRCLMRSLVLSSLLSRRGLQSTFVIGARAEPDFAAHAWVEMAGRPVLPDGGEAYGRLLEL
jgi:transglutaminase superfamily protein